MLASVLVSGYLGIKWLAYLQVCLLESRDARREDGRSERIGEARGGRYG